MSANRSNARRKEHKVSTCRTPVLRLRFEQLEDRCLLAGAPELLKDIFAGSGGSSISGFVEVGSVAYFSALMILMELNFGKAMAPLREQASLRISFLETSDLRRNNSRM